MSNHYIQDAYFYESEPEIFKTYANRVAFTGTVSDEGVKEENGRKVVPRGTVLDKDGKIASVSGGTGSDPAGILDKTVDVTHGPYEGPIVVEGYLRGARLNVTDHQDYSAITEALPEIKIDPESDED